MTYKRFEDLPVWKDAILLAQAVYEITDKSAFRAPASFRSQLESATLSVSNNIADGFERGTTRELLSFIYIARGSAGEVRSMLSLLEQHPNWTGKPDAASAITKIKQLAERCSRQLRGWADSLQNSDIQGARYLNRTTSDQYHRAKRAEEVRRKWLAKLPFDHPLRRAERERESGDD